jgi:hypothetical protein
MPDVVGRLLRPVFRKETVDVPAWFQLADLARIVARITDPTDVHDRIPDVQRLVMSAWQL